MKREFLFLILAVAILFCTGSFNEQPIVAVMNHGSLSYGIKAWIAHAEVSGGAGLCVFNPTNSNGSPFFKNVYVVMPCAVNTNTVQTYAMFGKAINHGINGTNISVLVAKGKDIPPGLGGPSVEYAPDGTRVHVMIVGD